MHYRLRTLLHWFKPILAAALAVWCFVGVVENPDPVFRISSVVIGVLFAISAAHHARRALLAN